MSPPPARDGSLFSLPTVVGLAILVGALLVQLAYEPGRAGQPVEADEAARAVDRDPATCPPASGLDSLEAGDAPADSALEAAVHVVGC